MPDEWHMRLFGYDVEEEQHDARHGLIESVLWEIAARVLGLGVNVILDFGFWAKVEREDYRGRAKKLGSGSEIHFLEVPKAELFERLAIRNADLSQGSTYIPEAKFIESLAIFQPSGPDELERRE